MKIVNILADLLKGFSLAFSRIFRILSILFFVVFIGLGIASFLFSSVESVLETLFHRAFPLSGLSQQENAKIVRARTMGRLEKLKVNIASVKKNSDVSLARISRAENEIADLKRLEKKAPSKEIRKMIARREAQLASARAELKATSAEISVLEGRLLKATKNPTGGDTLKWISEAETKITLGSRRVTRVGSLLDGEEVARKSLKLAINAHLKENASRLALTRAAQARASALNKRIRQIKSQKAALEREISALRTSFVKTRDRLSAKGIGPEAQKKLGRMESRLADLESSLKRLPVEDLQASVPTSKPVGELLDGLTVQETRVLSVEKKLARLGVSVKSEKLVQQTTATAIETEIEALARRRALREALPSVQSVRRRLFGFIRRDAADGVVQWIPIISAFSGYALLAKDIYDSCNMIKDLSKLESALNEATGRKDSTDVTAPGKNTYCGMTISQIFRSLKGGGPAAETACAEARKKFPLGEFDVCNDIPPPTLPDDGTPQPAAPAITLPD